jgi:hypothetical protein
MKIDSIMQWPQGIVCALLKTPEIVAGLPTGQQPTYENLSASMRYWWDNTIIPLEDAFADEIETQLFQAFKLDSADWRMAWDRSKVPALQEDEEAKHETIREDYKAGIIDLFTATTNLGGEPTDDMKGQRHPLATPKQEDNEDEAAPDISDIQKQRQLDAVKGWEENLHPRDEDGKFGSGGGVPAQAKEAFAKFNGKQGAVVIVEGKAMAPEFGGDSSHLSLEWPDNRNVEVARVRSGSLTFSPQDYVTLLANQSVRAVHVHNGDGLFSLQKPDGAKPVKATDVNEGYAGALAHVYADAAATGSSERDEEAGILAYMAKAFGLHYAMEAAQ